MEDKRQFIKLILIVAILALNGTSALAYPGDTDSSFYLSMYSFLYGPPVSNPGARSTPAAGIDYINPLSLQNQIGLEYDVTPNLSITPTFDVEYLFTDPFNNNTGQRFALSYDSFVKFRYNTLFGFDLGENRVNFDTEVRTYVPTSNFSRDNGTIGSVRFALNPYMNINGSNFSFSGVSAIRYWMQTEDTQFDSNNTLNRVSFYLGPQINYALSDKITFWTLLEFNIIYDTLGKPNYSDPSRSIADIEPGFDFKINDGIFISPYLNWFTNQSLESTSFNLTASIRI